MLCAVLYGDHVRADHVGEQFMRVSSTLHESSVPAVRVCVCCLRKIETTANACVR